MDSTNGETITPIMTQLTPEDFAGAQETFGENTTVTEWAIKRLSRRIMPTVELARIVTALEGKPADDITLDLVAFEALDLLRRSLLTPAELEAFTTVIAATGVTILPNTLAAKAMRKIVYLVRGLSAQQQSAMIDASIAQFGDCQNLPQDGAP